MEIRVSGHQVDTGTALQDHASARLSGISDKYFSRAISSQVTFNKAPANAFACDIVLHANQGLVMKSHGNAQDAHQAFDQAADKIEKQLRRYKRRLKDRHAQAEHAIQQEEAAYRIFDAGDPEAEEAPEAPPVVAETRTDIPEVSVADAVMLLDLRHTNALFFKNAGTGRHNMVYRRADGSIGWVEPS